MMKARVLDRLLKEFPWLWGMRPLWSAYDCWVAVHTAVEDYQIQFAKLLAETIAGRDELWLHVTREESVENGGIEFLHKVNPKHAAKFGMNAPRMFTEELGIVAMPSPNWNKVDAIISVQEYTPERSASWPHALSSAHWHIHIYRAPKEWDRIFNKLLLECRLP